MEPDDSDCYVIILKVGHHYYYYYYYKAAVVCVFYLVQKCWMQKPLNFANNLVNMISEFIENEAFTYQDYDF
jgi:hypothetical protein